MDRHDHTFKWMVKNHGGEGVTVWRFCGCGAVFFGNGTSGKWHVLDDAWKRSKGPWRKWFLRFLQAHDEVVRDVPDDLRSHLLRWARFTECPTIPEEDFDQFLLDYWNYSGRAPNARKLNASTISIETIDDTITPLTKESAVNFLIHAVRVQNGWVGQIIDESLNGEILFETVPQEDQVNDDHEVTITGLELAKRMASDKLTEVKRQLFR